MKRSHHVTAPLLAATALALCTGCRRPEMQRCVDENNKVVDPSFCKNLPPQQQPNNYHGGGGGFVPIFPYHYYYGGLGGYAPGSIASGGSTAPVAGRTYSTSPRAGFFSGSSRGGFGSSHGGGEGGGHGGGGGE